MNIALGYYSLAFNTGSNNLGVGMYALRSNQTGSANVALGSYALVNNTTASGNTAAGYLTLYQNTTGPANTGLGTYVLYRNKTGGGNTAVGYWAMGYSIAGGNNVAAGYTALYRTEASSNNVAIGAWTLRNNRPSVTNSVVVGAIAGYSTPSTGSLFLGYSAGRYESDSNTLYIENSNSSVPLIYGEFDNDFVTINSKLGIKTRIFDNNASGVLAIANGTVPTSSPANQIQLFAADVSGRSELHVRDEAGNVTTLSPHNFTLIPEGPSEPMAWSFYSERGTQAINIDMLKAVRLVEELSGEPLVHIKDLKTGKLLSPRSNQKRASALEPLKQKAKAVEAEAQALRHKWQQQEDQLHQLQKELSSLQSRLAQ